MDTAHTETQKKWQKSSKLYKQSKKIKRIEQKALCRAEASFLIDDKVSARICITVDGVCLKNITVKLCPLFWESVAL